MSGQGLHNLARFGRDQRGTTMIEFAICMSLFLLIFFAVLDFGRLAYNWVMAEKAMQRAVRIAAVRPPICPGLPLINVRADLSDGTFPAGTLCRESAGLCASAPAAICTLTTADPANPEAQAAASEIWTAVQAMLPEASSGVPISGANVMLRYDYTPQLGFLGGPYTPMITAQLVGPPGDGGAFGNFNFTFVTPLSALAAAAGVDDTTGIPTEGASIPFPDVSATIPAEDMNLGGRG